MGAGGGEGGEEAFHSFCLIACVWNMAFLQTDRKTDGSGLVTLSALHKSAKNAGHDIELEQGKTQSRRVLIIKLISCLHY